MNMIDIAQIRNHFVIAAIARIPRQEPPTFSEVKQVVSEVCRVNIERLNERKNRHYDIVIARYIAWKIIRESNKKVTLTNIGLEFGGYDHTTILHGVGVITDRIERESDISNKYELSMRKLRLKLNDES